jgi:hypothetical protein
MTGIEVLSSQFLAVDCFLKLTEREADGSHSSKRAPFRRAMPSVTFGLKLHEPMRQVFPGNA